MEIEQELKKFDIAEAVISQWSKDYMMLTVADLDDKEGCKAVKEARLTVKSKRVEVEKKRKELKEDSLRFGRAIDTEAKRITSLLEPIETYLQSQEDVIGKEAERIKLEAERIAKERLQHRINTLMGYRQGFDATRLESMIDAEQKAERDRLAELDRAQRIE